MDFSNAADVKGEINIDGTTASVPSSKNVIISNSNLTKLSFPSLQFFDYDWAISSSPLVFDESQLKRNNDFQLLKLMPTGFTLSGNIGTFLELSFLGSPKKLSGGLRGQIHYGDQFSLVVGAKYLSNDFKEDIGNPSELSNYPPINGNDPSDPVKEVYGNFDYLQIPFGMQYTFQSKGRWRPFFSVGLISQKSLKSQLLFEFRGIREEYKKELNNLVQSIIYP